MKRLSSWGTFQISPCLRKKESLHLKSSIKLPHTGFSDILATRAGAGRTLFLDVETDFSDFPVFVYKQEFAPLTKGARAMFFLLQTFVATSHVGLEGTLMYNSGHARLLHWCHFGLKLKKTLRPSTDPLNCITISPVCAGHGRRPGWGEAVRIPLFPLTYSATSPTCGVFGSREGRGISTGSLWLFFRSGPC